LIKKPTRFRAPAPPRAQRVLAGEDVGSRGRAEPYRVIAQGLLQATETPELRITRMLFALSRKDVRSSAAALAFLAPLGKGQGAVADP
jgi:hypothetical protein